MKNRRKFLNFLATTPATVARLSHDCRTTVARQPAINLRLATTGHDWPRAPRPKIFAGRFSNLTQNLFSGCDHPRLSIFDPRPPTFSCDCRTTGEGLVNDCRTTVQDCLRLRGRWWLQLVVSCRGVQCDWAFNYDKCLSCSLVTSSVLIFQD